MGQKNLGKKLNSKESFDFVVVKHKVCLQIERVKDCVQKYLRIVCEACDSSFP